VPEVVAHLGMFISHGAATVNVNPSRFWPGKGPLLLFISENNKGEEILYDYGAAKASFDRQIKLLSAKENVSDNCCIT
jgi:hypothetical protein